MQICLYIHSTSSECLQLADSDVGWKMKIFHYWDNVICCNVVIIHCETCKCGVCEVIRWRGVLYTPARCVATSITEPLLAGVAVHHTRWIVDTTVAERDQDQNSILITAVHNQLTTALICGRAYFIKHLMCVIKRFNNKQAIYYGHVLFMRAGLFVERTWCWYSVMCYLPKLFVRGKHYYYLANTPPSVLELCPRTVATPRLGDKSNFECSNYISPLCFYRYFYHPRTLNDVFNLCVYITVYLAEVQQLVVKVITWLTILIIN